MTERNRIVFFDTTLRDGEQSPGCTMHHEEKLRMAHQLGTLGVDVIEAGFPVSSEGDFRSVQAIAREVRKGRGSPGWRGPSVRTLRRRRVQWKGRNGTGSTRFCRRRTFIWSTR